MMKKNPMQLLIFDEKQEMSKSLTKFIKRKFGGRINVHPFPTSINHIDNIDNKAHLIVLDYVSKYKPDNHQEVILHYLKERNPGIAVFNIASDKVANVASEEIRLQTSKYIMKNEKQMPDRVSYKSNLETNPIPLMALKLKRKNKSRLLAHDYFNIIILLVFISMFLTAVGYMFKIFFERE